MRSPKPRLHHLVVLFAALALLRPAAAAAQVSTDTQKCVAEINNGARKVLVAESSAINSCIKSFVKGSLGAPTIAACAAPASSAGVQRAVAKATADAAKKCHGAPPSFGPPSITAQPLMAVQAGTNTLTDVFSSDVEGSLLTDASGTGCQQFVNKAVQKCEDARIKEFLRCKKDGMKRGTITDTASLQAQCLGSGASDQPDPKFKIALTCLAKVQAQVNASCVAKGIALSSAFPGCSAANSTTLTQCLDSRARCRTCAMLNGVDGIATDCDLYDDGNDLNGSCPEPTTCGDLLIDGLENCEDGDAVSGDGCSSSCQIEPGWLCAGLPTVCQEVCGDGLVVGSEQCDDGGVVPGDGCSATCQVETGYNCTGAPSTCSSVCGDGLIIGGEECDDGNHASFDGCSSSCDIEGGFSCTGQPSTCTHFDVVITSPANGSFTTGSTANVTGTVLNLAPALAGLTVNGNPVTVQPNGTFSTTVPLSASAIFNPILANLTDTVHGGQAHDRVVAIVGNSVADGALSPQSVALRLNDTGLDQVEPLIGDLAGAGLDLAQLVPVGTILVNNECFIDSIFGCLGRATVRIVNPPPSVSGFELAADSMTNFVAGDVTVNNIAVHVNIEGSGLVPSCPLTITANHAFFFGDYNLSPDPIIPSNIDVNQVGPLDVAFDNFQTQYGGLCDAPIIGDIIQAFIPDVESLTINALHDFLDDPDGAGPQDGPIADGIETALAGISIAGPIGQALHVNLETPLFAVNEDNVGITLGSDMRVTTSIGNGPDQCQPPPGAPNLTRSLAFNEVFPSFGQNSPVSGIPYDVAISISAEGFNQLLKGQTECGLLVTSLNEIDIGLGPLPITAGLLSVLLPPFQQYPAMTPFRIDVRPTIAPIVTGAAGPAGELTELRVANVLGELVRDDGSNEVALTMAFDTHIGMDLQFSPSGLGIVLSPVDPSAITIAIVDNPLNVSETALVNDLLPPLIANLLPSLSSSLSSFPLPEFFGLALDGVEVSRQGQFLSLYATLSPVP